MGQGEAFFDLSTYIKKDSNVVLDYKKESALKFEVI
jgi:hypothetical protein